jgi:hypothetical protein
LGGGGDGGIPAPSPTVIWLGFIMGFIDIMGGIKGLGPLSGGWAIPCIPLGILGGGMLPNIGGG